jgi:hypothetical protein
MTGHAELVADHGCRIDDCGTLRGLQQWQAESTEVEYRSEIHCHHLVELLITGQLEGVRKSQDSGVIDQSMQTPMLLLDLLDKLLQVRPIRDISGKELRLPSGSVDRFSYLAAGRREIREQYGRSALSQEFGTGTPDAVCGSGDQDIPAT